MNKNTLLIFKGLVRIATLALSLVVLLGLCAFAQETTGSITGTVTDPTGAAIPNAKIEISGPAVVGVASISTDTSGAYTAGSIPAGQYVVVATAQGFRSMRKTDVSVVLGRAARVDFRMEVGQVTESVVVNADAVMVDTTTSQSAVNVDKSFFDLLPKGRGFYDLIAIAPGARNEAKTGGFQIDGASGSENTFYLDGMEVTNMQTGVLDAKNRIPVEAIQQVQIKNGVMEAQYGGAMGGVVNAVVRSGSNQFHGEAGFYYNNDSMSARPRPTLEMDPTDATRSRGRYFQNTLDDYSTWNPVFSLSGPIIKNKLSFFSSYMPTTTTTNRPVTFLSNNQTQTFSRKEKQQYVVNKLDFMPFTKLRMNASWIWSPNYQQGVLPAQQGTDSPTTPFAGRGQYTQGQILSGQVDYLATSKLVFSFRGGYNYTNQTDRYAVSSETFVYSTANTMFPNLPANVQRTAAGYVSQGGARRDYDIYTRVNLNADVSYMLNWHGQHNLKGGWQTNRLSNSVQNLSYPTGYYRYYWDQSYTCVTSQCSGKQRGTYGYYRWYTYGESGDASSDNQGIFFQDNWRVNKNLSLNLGLRTEREFLPSFSKQGIAAAPPISFSWGSKMSPRIGGAWDPKGDGKMRVYASWGYFFDVMKYEMPRGSFGGAIYITNYYALDDPNVMITNQGYPADPKKLPGRLFESVDWRIPSNDPNNNTVDKNLKPMKQRMLDVGFDYSLKPTLVASLRYTNRRLIRTIEDVGTLGPAGEVYFIANPGFGLTVDPKTWDAGIPPTPKAKRDYDALEFRLDKRFSRNYQFAASYTWSRSFGNYSGLASSDEDVSATGTGLGRTAPNVNRYFDLPWIGYDQTGHFAEGRLGTDRPHTLKLFGSYSKRSLLGTTTISPVMALYSGTPLTTNIFVISSVPAYPFGRGDLGRTPVFYNADLNLMHEFRPMKNHENVRVRFEFTVFNLFNSSIVTNKNVDMLHVDDGQLTFANNADFFKGFDTNALIKAQGDRISPLYNLASGFQGPRWARLQLSFQF
jgi:outer membrane receptor protein involved in Fe transport